MFLDFDGVICSPRAFVAQEGRWYGDQQALRWADPVACDLVCKLLREFEPWLVVSSTWRGSLARCTQVLGRYGLDEFLHDDWRTGDDPERYRGNEVRQWLDEHGNPPFLILDDDSDFDDDQKPFLVNSCSYDGFSLKNYEAAKELLAAMAREGNSQ